MEYRLVAAQSWLRQLLRGETITAGGTTMGYPRAVELAEQLRGQLGYLAPAPARVRQLVSLCSSTAPGQGWAFTDQRTRGARGGTFVRLYLPRRAERPARAWLRFVRELSRLVARVGQLAQKLIPALRTSSIRRGAETGLRDQIPADQELAATLERIGRRFFTDSAM